MFIESWTSTTPLPGPLDLDREVADARQPLHLLHLPQEREHAEEVALELHLDRELDEQVVRLGAGRHDVAVAQAGLIAQQRDVIEELPPLHLPGQLLLEHRRAALRIGDLLLDVRRIVVLVWLSRSSCCRASISTSSSDSFSVFGRKPSMTKPADSATMETPSTHWARAHQPIWLCSVRMGLGYAPITSLRFIEKYTSNSRIMWPLSIRGFEPVMRTSSKNGFAGQLREKVGDLDVGRRHAAHADVEPAVRSRGHAPAPPCGDERHGLLSLR
jgi:hypothetical protein